MGVRSRRVLVGRSGSKVKKLLIEGGWSTLWIIAKYSLFFSRYGEMGRSGGNKWEGFGWWIWEREGVGQIGVWARKGKNKKFPSPKKGCPEKEGLRQVSGWNIHTCSSFVLWLVHILDISSGYFNLPSNWWYSVVSEKEKKWYTC